MKRSRRAQAMRVNLIDDPQYSMHLDVMGCRKCSKRTVSGEQNAARMGFSEGKSEAVVNRKLRSATDNLLCPEDTFTWKIHHLQATANERLFLGARELEKLLLEQGIRDENLVRQLQESIE